MDEDKVKYFEEEFPEIFSGVDALIQKKMEERDKGREAGTDALIEVKLRQREFFKVLNEKISNWETIWKSREFQDFLGEPHELSGVSHYDIIRNHFASFDAPRVIGFFRAFFDRKSKGLHKGQENPRDPSSRTMSIETARRRLKELASERARGLWRNREKDYQAESNRLVKLITGRGE